ncbi:hypothetical protein PF002_g32718 [Phytophthora fragariae]|uniref:Uncharacterized protein n=1 Tax=Phytophthora fragariae TaxID=53985 RepID=A0A6A3V794_9STRA|nr:hypothetical protein PF002_g32718 [Phytophthora fragariae]
MTSCGCPPANSVRQAWPMLVMVSAVADDKLRLPTSKQCPAACRNW